MDVWRIHSELSSTAPLHIIMKLILLAILAILTSSCNSQEKTNGSYEMNESQIGEYVTSVFEDSKGNLWFGTIHKGIARFDGSQLQYFTNKDGLPTNRVTGVIEDEEGNYWFSTDMGILKYDGTEFTHYPVKKNDWQSNSISQLLIDSKGEFWVGTWGGVYQFDGREYTPFPLPYPKVNTPINEDTKYWITQIKEDNNGHIWFARDGYGITKYDGKEFTHILKNDGLHSNNVTVIEFDQEGNFWFGTRVAEKDNPDPQKRVGKGGVNQLVNKAIISIPDIEEFNNDDVYEIYRDESGNIWISTIKNGVYRYDGEEFKNYAIPISIMGITEDKKGNIWFSGAGGLYRINPNEEIINVTTNGPWGD